MHESINSKQLRARLGRYLTQVEQGLTLVVTRQGQAIAELRPYGVEHEQNGHVEPGAAPPPGRPPTPARVSALGLTAYQYSLDNLDKEPTLDESAPEQADQNGHAGPLEAESADLSSPSPPAKRSRSSRSHRPKAAAAKRQPRRRTGAGKKSS